MTASTQAVSLSSSAQTRWLPSAQIIFGAHVPTLQRIPGDVRSVFSRVLAKLSGKETWEKMRDSKSAAAEHAWLKFFFFTVVILAKTTKKLKRKSGVTGPVRERLIMWENREYTELWKAVSARVDLGSDAKMGQ